MSNLDSVFKDMEKRYTTGLVQHIENSFKNQALGIFAFNCELYTEETRKSWKVSASHQNGVYTWEFGNSAPQALYSEYGTIRKFSLNKVTIGNKTFTSVTSKAKDKRRRTGVSAWDAIHKWCIFKGITDRNAQFAIYKEIMKNGRKKSKKGMYTALPKTTSLLVRILKRYR